MRKYIIFSIYCLFFCCVGNFSFANSESVQDIKLLNDFKVKLNPYENNELAALVEFELLEPAHIILTVKGRDGAEDVVYTDIQSKTKHSIEVLGLYPDYDNQIVLKAIYSNKVQEKKIIIPVPKIKKRGFFVITKKKDAKNRYHWLSDGSVFDEYGWLRFAFKGNGTIFYWLNNEVIGEARNDGLYRYSPAGKLLQHYKYPKGFTSFAHGLGQKTNGNFLVIGSFADTYILVDGEKQKTHRDFVIEIDYNTGKVLNKVDLAEILNPNRSVIIPRGNFDYGMNDWCHINGVDYDSADGGIVVSCRHSGIIKINEKTHKLNWMITPRKGFEVSGRQGKGPDIHNKVLMVVDKKGIPYNSNIQKGEETALPDFKWPTKTHNVRVFGKGIFGVFDNSGEVHDEKIVSTDDSYASLFKVDEQAHTVSQYWIQPLGVHSVSGSSVVYNADNKEVIVFISQVFDKNQHSLSHADLIRYDFDTHEELFHAIIYKGGVSWLYLSDEFVFYPSNKFK